MVMIVVVEWLYVGQVTFINIIQKEEIGFVCFGVADVGTVKGIVLLFPWETDIEIGVFWQFGIVADNDLFCVQWVAQYVCSVCNQRIGNGLGVVVRHYEVNKLRVEFVQFYPLTVIVCKLLILNS